MLWASVREQTQEDGGVAERVVAVVVVVIGAEGPAGLAVMKDGGLGSLRLGPR